MKMLAYKLTNYGKKCADALSKDPSLSRFYSNNVEEGLLGYLGKNTLIKPRDYKSLSGEEKQALDSMVKQELAERVKKEGKWRQFKKNAEKDYEDSPIKTLSIATFELTYDCNTQCPQCYHSDEQRAMGQLSTGEVKEIIDTVKKAGVKYFYFHGGEPTIRKDLLELVNYASEDGKYMVSIVTNGSWGNNAENFAKKLKTNGTSLIYFSIDGVGNAHDEARKHPGLFQKNMQAIKASQEAGIDTIITYNPRPNETRQMLEREMAKYIEISNIPEIITTTTLFQVGNGASLPTRANSQRVKFEDLKGDECLSLFNPGQIIVRADGNISPCWITYAGGEYGNIHKQSLVKILNNIQETELYKNGFIQKID